MCLLLLRVIPMLGLPTTFALIHPRALISDGIGAKYVFLLPHLLLLILIIIIIILLLLSLLLLLLLLLLRGQVAEERMEMTELQNQNQQILCNMLPTHVAKYFIDHATTTEVVSVASMC